MLFRSPAAKLEIQGGGGAASTLQITASGAGNNAFLKMADGTTGGTWDLQSLTDGSFSLARTGSRQLTVSSSGNVGIGTTAPTTGFHLKGASAAGVATIERTSLNGAGAGTAIDLVSDAKTVGDGSLISYTALDSASNATDRKSTRLNSSH